MTHLTPSGLPCYRADGHTGKCRHVRPDRDWEKEYQQRKARLALPSVRISTAELQWQWDALCGEAQGSDPDLWFPEDWMAEPGSMQWIKQEQRAKRTCEACPVRAQCLQFAHSNRISEGIWGGLMPGERAELRVSA